MRYKEWTKILGWPGYQVYQCEINEERKTLKLWVRRKPGTKKLICSGCGRHCGEIHDTTERLVRDLPWSEYTATGGCGTAPSALSAMWSQYSSIDGPSICARTVRIGDARR